MRQEKVFSREKFCRIFVDCLCSTTCFHMEGGRWGDAEGTGRRETGSASCYTSGNEAQWFRRGDDMDTPEASKLERLLPDLRANETFEAEYLALVPCTDPRIADIIRDKPRLRVLVEGFVNQYGGEVHPYVLISRADAPDSMMSAEAFAAFRNIFALSCVLHGAQRTLSDENCNVFHTVWSDHFDFYPVHLNKDEDSLVFLSPAHQGSMTLESFRGYTSPYLPVHVVAKPELSLMGPALALWRKRFISSRQTWRTRVFFRSLEVAYQAASMPIGNKWISPQVAPV